MPVASAAPVTPDELRSDLYLVDSATGELFRVVDAGGSKALLEDCRSAGEDLSGHLLAPDAPRWVEVREILRRKLRPLRAS